MVFCDGAEWSRGPGIDNASEVCPELRGIVRDEYQQSMRSGCWRVYLRTSSPR